MTEHRSTSTDVLSADLLMLFPARSITETEIETSCMLVMLSVTPTTTSQSLKLPETGLACLIDPPRLTAGTFGSSFDVNVRVRLSPTLANEELLSLSDRYDFGQIGIIIIEGDLILTGRPTRCPKVSCTILKRNQEIC